MIKVIKPDFEFQDERGFLLQLVHEGFRQFNIIFSRQGVFRGGHYHQENTEAFYVISGSFELTVKTENAVEEKYIISKGEMFFNPAICFAQLFLS